MLTEGARGVALVTGASRGIGAATAIKLAEAGFDVAVTARTMTDDDAAYDGWPSLATTAAAIKAVGRRAMPIWMDLADIGSVVAAADKAEAEFGPIDVLVNNAIYDGSGMGTSLLDTPIEDIQESVRAAVISWVALLQTVLPRMVERGGGKVVNLTSSVVFLDPPGPIGEGGWGFAYGMVKGAQDRMAGFINADLGEKGVVAFSIEPGFVATLSTPAEPSFQVESTPAEAIGAAIAWLVTNEDALQFRNRRVHGPELAKSRKLLPGWPSPESAGAGG
jgi:hypothetical protein